VLAVGLSILTALLAALFAPKGSVTTIFIGWYNGLFSILAFAFQVLLVLVTGFALSTSAPVRADSCLKQRGLRKSDKFQI
jgi:short-chain fatty acids transporter